ncbi:hypothetical protein, partial [uncultured Parasutterella sp.]|uniref:hypothetical protein n=1 Tax=uncultured Parasutterella sp. TaxID=1263098 RepID=UPI00272D09EC
FNCEARFELVTESKIFCSALPTDLLPICASFVFQCLQSTNRRPLKGIHTSSRLTFYQGNI